MTSSLDSGAGPVDPVKGESEDAASAASTAVTKTKAPARKPAAKKPAAKKPAAKKPAPTPEEKAAAAKTSAARTAAAKRAAAQATGAKTAAARKEAATSAAKTAAVKEATARTTQAKAAAKSTTARTSAAKTAAAKAAAAKTASEKAATEATDGAAAPRKPAARKPAAKKTTKTTATKTTATKTTPASATKTAAAKKTAATKTTAAKTAAVKKTAAKTAASKTTASKTTVSKATDDTTTSPVTQAPATNVTAAGNPSEPEESLTATAVIDGTAETLTAADDDAAPMPIIELDPPVTIADGTERPRAAAHDAPRGDVALAPKTDADAAVVAEPRSDDPDVSVTPEVAAPELPASVPSDAIAIRGLVKKFGDTRAVDGIDLTVPSGSFYGLVGPNGAGKTTTLSIIAGLLRPDAGTVEISGIDQRANPLEAKRVMGVLPDRLRTFDRLTGRQLLHYYGQLRGLERSVIEKRTADLARAFDLTEALSRVVSDYSAGMTKKLMLAGAMIHSPRVLVLDEPFEAVDPVSSSVILDILRAYVAHGGTVILSSHGMDLVERVCSRVAIIVAGDVLAEGTIDEVRAGQTLEARFVELSGGGAEVEGLEWLHTFSA
ncbi:ABC transporter ATP-binding protein [Microbacterium istanbulense]|uniref:ATP-binding cassette domain-containing protein n=1 Tax=Microbacterium istanbulense TaxID=3122049 RepID=A0ABU8LMG5_9MICO